MAIPVALITLASEGLLMFRRVLTLYNYTKEAGSLLRHFDSDPDKADEELKYHKSVPGEEIYLFILLRETISQSLTIDKVKTSLTTSEIDELIAAALVQSIDTRTAVDLDNTVIHVCYTLGAFLQRKDPVFMLNLEQYVEGSIDKTILQDPVLKYIQLNEGSRDASIEQMMKALNLDASLLSDIYSSLQHSQTFKDWVNFPKRLTNKSSRYLKSQTVIGYIIRGAQSVVFNDLRSIEVQKGMGALQLRMLIHVNPRPVIYARKRLPVVSTLTREIIDSVSIAETKRQGYVAAEDIDGNRTWAPRLSTIAIPITDAQGNVKVKTKVKPTGIDAVIENVQQVKGTAEKIASTYSGTKKLISALTGVAKKVVK